MMPPDLSTAFDNAVRDYLASPAALPSLLDGLERTAAGTGSAASWSRACSSP